MRLLALRAETMQAMRRLKLPCDDITPIGLWGSDMFLIGVNNDQFEVLRLWNVQTEDVTPATLRDLHTESSAIPTSPSAGNAASGARSSAKGAPSAAPASPTTPPAGRPSSAPESSPEPSRPSGSKSVTVDRAAVVLEREDDQDEPDAVLARAEPAGDMKPAFTSAAPSAAPAAPTGDATAARPAPDTRPRNGSAGTPSMTATVPEERSAPSLQLESDGSRGESKSVKAPSEPAVKPARTV